MSEVFCRIALYGFATVLGLVFLLMMSVLGPGWPDGYLSTFDRCMSQTAPFGMEQTGLSALALIFAAELKNYRKWIVLTVVCLFALRFAEFSYYSHYICAGLEDGQGG
ncbi:hypothetical protein [Halocynthiibacter sp.]|uniref:hypothetical protein n=1 Tax=Halocynthiibacter sp. TaxID=1979210 RepID=UPI003C4AB514